jgi:hypothetical protein
VHHVTEQALLLPLPVHPRIFRYVAPSMRVARLMARREDVSGATIDVVESGVDLLRFTKVRQPPPKPGRVLVYDDELTPDSGSVNAIRRAADELGMEFALLGRRLGRAVDDPEAHLREFDIVCARSVKALEAVCSGCAVLPIDRDRCGKLIDESSFERTAEAGFVLDEVDGVTASPEFVGQAFSAFSSSSCLRLAARARAAFAFDGHALRMDAVYRAAIEAGRARVDDHDAEQRATSEYLDRIAVMIKDMDQIQKSKGDVPLATASKLVDVSAKLAAIQTDLDKPQW